MSDGQQLDRIWELRRQKSKDVIEQFACASGVMHVIGIRDGPDEVRAMLAFDIETLVKRPGKSVTRRGPVITGMRYHRQFLAVAPNPSEIVQVIRPTSVFHPNVWPNGALCLGHPRTGISMDEVLHLTWAALTLNTRRVNTVAWDAANEEAADYVRARKDLFPLTRIGLLEPAGAEASKEAT